MDAYRHGIFPWFDEPPILWFSPDPRAVLAPAELHVPRRLDRTIRQGAFEVTLDQAFGEVIRACAKTPRRGQEGTWINRDMIEAYEALFVLGFAHSCEAWRDGALVGGIYGVSLGRAFFGESMFHRERDASKVALVSLCRLLDRSGYALLDCQVENEHLLSMGAKPVAREAFLDDLAEALARPGHPAPWPPAP